MQLKVLLAALCLVVFLLISLVLLANLRQSLQPKPVFKSPPSVQALSRPAPVVDLREVLESALVSSGIPSEQIEGGEEAGVVTLDVRSQLPASGLLAELQERMGRAAPGARVVVGAGGDSLVVFLGERPAYLLRFRPQPVEPPPVLPPVPVPVPASGARIAIIMDDLGRDMASARTLLDIDLSVTFAILPYNEQAPKVAALAHRHGREVIVHIPMEPQGYPARNPGPDALLVDLPAEEIRRRFQSYLSRVPHAVGGNNHMGSRFTQQREKMEVVIDEMRKAGLFFVDSRTSPDSVAFDVARSAGVAAAGRDVFLDNVQDEELIAREIRRLVRIALKKGEALGICHPYPQTLAALRREAEYIRSQGVEVVPASQLLVR